MAKKKSFDADSYPGSIDRLHINPNMFPFDAFPISRDGDDKEIKMDDSFGIHGRLRFKAAGSTAIGTDTTLEDDNLSYLYYVFPAINDVTITLPPASTNMGKMGLFLFLTFSTYKGYIAPPAGTAILCNGGRILPGSSLEVGSQRTSSYGLGYVWIFGMTALYYLAISYEASAVKPPYKYLSGAVAGAASVTIPHGLNTTQHPIYGVSGAVTDTARQVIGTKHDATNVYLYFDAAATGTATAIIYFAGGIP